MSLGPVAVVLASGGMDSCVAAAIGATKYRLAFLHCRYGQRTERRERAAFESIADHFGVVERRILSLDFLSAIGGSSLTDHSIPVPEGNTERKEIPTTYVPFRNAIFLSAAVSWAEVIGAEVVIVGAVEEDSSGYPDCRAGFFEAFNRVVAAGTKAGGRLRVETPVIGKSKGEIVSIGISLGAPLHLTWSCYQSEDEACGRCDSCLLRRRGFAEAGISDPIQYRRPDPMVSLNRNHH